jgi:hypothetical protein
MRRTREANVARTGNEMRGAFQSEDVIISDSWRYSREIGGYKGTVLVKAAKMLPRFRYARHEFSGHVIKNLSLPGCDTAYLGRYLPGPHSARSASSPSLQLMHLLACT